MPHLRVNTILLTAFSVLVLVMVAVLVAWLFFRDPSSEEVVGAFREEGLEVGEAYPIEKAEGPSPRVPSRLPGTYEEGTRFVIPSLGKDSAGRDLGGLVFTFESKEDLAEMSDFYEGLGEANSSLFSWVFVEGDVLVQISGSLPEDQARQYEAVLEEVAG